MGGKRREGERRRGGIGGEGSERTGEKTVVQCQIKINSLFK